MAFRLPSFFMCRLNYWEKTTSSERIYKEI
nr:MAG TPA_asm: hypothetical protein [Caudoviricetes sp.]